MVRNLDCRYLSFDVIPRRVMLILRRCQMKEIQLTQGKVCLIDNEDFERISKYRWQYNGNYASRKIENTTLYMHSFMINVPKGKYTEHINGNPLDNRRKNLRICSKAENMKNQKLSKLSTSGFKGVYWSKHAKL